MSIRKIKNILMIFILSFASGLCLLPLFSIIFFLIKNGIGYINIDFFMQNPKPFGEIGGGMLNSIVGTIVVVFWASIIGIPFALTNGIFLYEYRKTKIAYIVRLLTEVLQGLPSIVIGIIAYSWLVKRMGHFSSLSGSLALAIMMVPIISRNTEEVLLLIPNTLKEASLALGVTRVKTAFSVVLKTGINEILGGILSAVARVSGETAPLIFTAFGNRFFSTNIMKPMSTLTLQIYDYARSPYKELHKQAWAGALTLVFLVLVLTLVSRLIVKNSSRYSKE